MATTTINTLVLAVRTMIRDTGIYPNQAFMDVLDTEAPPQPILGSSPELQQFVFDSVVNHYSRWMPRRRPWTLTLNPGQTVYVAPTDLPPDWKTVDNVSFNKVIAPAPLPNWTAYALPFIEIDQSLGVQANKMDFRWYDSDIMLILGAAPLGQYTLTFDYFAYHQCDSSGCSVPIYEQHYALLPAAEHALRALATDQSVKLQKYKMGGRYGLDIDDTAIAKNLIALADSYADQFTKEVVQRPYGTSGGGEQDYYANW